MSSAVSTSTAKTKEKAAKKGHKGPSPQEDPVVGKVLRSVYQQTIDETVPQEMLDLLNKLG